MKIKPPTFAQVCDFGNLALAAKKAIKGRWRTRREQAEFRLNLGNELLQIQESLLNRTYFPLSYRTFYVRDPKQRLISAAPIRDRVVHHALIEVVGPWLERSFIEHSYACRKNKGTHCAIEYAQKNVRRYRYCIHLDVVKFFDSIDHRILKKMLCKKIVDDGIMWLMTTIIDHVPTRMPKGKSVPIGNLTSQYFGNLYLDALDHFVKDRLGVKGYLRYMDDFLLFHNDRATLKKYVAMVREFTTEKLEVKLASATIDPVSNGIFFLGLRIFPYLLRLQQKRWKRFKCIFKAKQRAFQEGRINEEHFLLSVAAMVDNLKNANTYHLRGPFFEKYTMDL